VLAASLKARSLGDRQTAAVLTEVSRGIDKWIWFVESHLNTN
jgi:DNA-binding ferritin-like protein